MTTLLPKAEKKPERKKRPALVTAPPQRTPRNIAGAAKTFVATAVQGCETGAKAEKGAGFRKASHTVGKVLPADSVGTGFFDVSRRPLPVRALLAPLTERECPGIKQSVHSSDASTHPSDCGHSETDEEFLEVLCMLLQGNSV